MIDSVFIIAEAGVNHNGSLDLALKLVDAAADAGADAIKFQTFKAAALVTRSAPKAEYQTQRAGTAESQFEMLRQLELSRSQHESLIAHSLSRGIEFISTPFDQQSLSLLQELQVRRLKISSGELTNSPLLLQAARSGLPLILSTGMATLEEIADALMILAFGYLEPRTIPSTKSLESHFSSNAAKRVLQEKVTLLHCTTEYPAPFDEVNLLAIDTLRGHFQLPCGFSDHTPGIAASVAAVARRATTIEKHLTLDRGLPGPDHHASLELNEFQRLVQSIREVEKALGSREKGPTPSELRNLAVVRKSVVAATSIAAGQPFTGENLTTKRPGTGIPPREFWDLLGTTADRDYQPDDLIQRP